MPSRKIPSYKFCK